MVASTLSYLLNPSLGSVGTLGYPSHGIEPRGHFKMKEGGYYVTLSFMTYSTKIPLRFGHVNKVCGQCLTEGLHPFLCKSLNLPGNFYIPRLHTEKLNTEWEPRIKLYQSNISFNLLSPFSYSMYLGSFQILYLYKLYIYIYFYVVIYIYIICNI